MVCPVLRQGQPKMQTVEQELMQLLKKLQMIRLPILRYWSKFNSKKVIFINFINELLFILQSDIFSFGMVLLEVLRPMKTRQELCKLKEEIVLKQFPLQLYQELFANYRGWVST